MGTGERGARTKKTDPAAAQAAPAASVTAATSVTAAPGPGAAQGEHEIRFQIEGLIRLLAEHLYADPDVFLREMIQNAHDSIVKRRALAEDRGETGNRKPPAPAIHVVPSPEAMTLTIEDNGAGLAEDEIHEPHTASASRCETRPPQRPSTAMPWLRRRFSTKGRRWPKPWTRRAGATRCATRSRSSAPLCCG